MNRLVNYRLTIAAIVLAGTALIAAADDWPEITRQRQTNRPVVVSFVEPLEPERLLKFIRDYTITMDGLYFGMSDLLGSHRVSEPNLVDPEQAIEELYLRLLKLQRFADLQSSREAMRLLVRYGPREFQEEAGVFKRARGVLLQHAADQQLEALLAERGAIVYAIRVSDTTLSLDTISKDPLVHKVDYRPHKPNFQRVQFPAVASQPSSQRTETTSPEDFQAVFDGLKALAELMPKEVLPSE